MEGEKVSVYRATQIFRNFLYDYRDQLMASILVGGYDKKEGGQVQYRFLLLFCEKKFYFLIFNAIFYLKT